MDINVNKYESAKYGLSLRNNFCGTIWRKYTSEKISVQLIIASIFMIIGIWLHLTEYHSHEHEHEEMEHEHRHIHDEHHQHEHVPTDPPGEPHTHWHKHEALRHSHPHYPDIHHRHPH